MNIVSESDIKNSIKIKIFYESEIPDLIFIDIILKHTDRYLQEYLEFTERNILFDIILNENINMELLEFIQYLSTDNLKHIYENQIITTMTRYQIITQIHKNIEKNRININTVYINLSKYHLQLLIKTKYKNYYLSLVDNLKNLDEIDRLYKEYVRVTFSKIINPSKTILNSLKNCINEYLRTRKEDNLLFAISIYPFLREYLTSTIN